MRTHRHEFVLASLLALAACDARESHAAAAKSSAPVPPAESERTPVPASDKPAAMPSETPPPVPSEPQLAPVESSPLPEPVEANADVLAQAIARAESRATGLRELASELRGAVEALGESATPEQREGATALGDLLTVLDAKLDQLRTCVAADAAHFESAANEAAAALEKRAAELKALLP